MAVALVHQFGGMTSNDSILISTTLSDVPGVSMHTQTFQGPFCTKNATVLESALFCLCHSLSVSCRLPCSPAMPVSLGQRARKIIQMLKNYGGVKQYGFERRGILVPKVFLVDVGEQIMLSNGLEV